MLRQPAAVPDWVPTQLWPAGPHPSRTQTLPPRLPPTTPGDGGWHLRQFSTFLEPGKPLPEASLGHKVPAFSFVARACKQLQLKRESREGGGSGRAFCRGDRVHEVRHASFHLKLQS